MTVGGRYDDMELRIDTGEGTVNCLEEEKWRATRRGCIGCAVYITEVEDHSIGLQIILALI